MTRDPIHTAAAYHRLTGYRRDALTPHALDWGHQPRLDKRYPKLEQIPLPTPPVLPQTDYFDLVHRASKPLSSPLTALDQNTLATLLHLTHAITAQSRHGNQAFYFRSVASAGALYPFEMYLAVHDIQGLAPGIYHVDVFRFGLTRLRAGDVPVMPPVGQGVAGTLYITGIFFRSAWKYRNRAYRYVLLDAGHLLENLRLAAHAVGVDLSVHLDFDDDRIATLLGVDAAEEVCLIGAHLNAGKAVSPDAAELPQGDLPPLPEAVRHASRVSDKVIAYDAVLDIHRAGHVATGVTADGPHPSPDLGWRPRNWQSLPTAPAGRHTDYVQVIGQRRSGRNFIPQAIGEADLAGFLHLIANAATADPPGGPQGVPGVGVVVGEGLSVAPGVYQLDSHGRRLGQVAAGNRLDAMARACLDQMWLRNAALHIASWPTRRRWIGPGVPGDTVMP
ncbi:SagB/ThcOx family dehydrogenase [Desulfosarcina cetonica]|uniref:SagB/ThcOx family dehydrogenase n=1 Tax=Desulfosarcina cetonica TaxID=90730 RepID=UPI0006CFC794|nr:SagB/ThcOx family dehydrogenase [Desulfosarcina cetonica]